MEMDIAVKLLNDPGIIRKLVEAVGDEDLGELTLVRSYFEPREQHIASLWGKMRLERGNVCTSIYYDGDGDVHVVVYATECLHLYHMELFDSAIDCAIDTIADIGERHVYVYTIAGLHVELTSLGRLRNHDIFGFRPQIKMRTRTCSDAPDIGEFFEVINGKPTKTTTDLGNAAQEIALGK